MKARWTIALAVALTLVVSACAKHPPRLTPQQRAHDEVPLAEAGTVEVEDRMDITIPAFDPLHGAGPSDQINARFRGTDRKDPKTSIAPGSREKFDSIADLVHSLPSDEEMLHHDPAIERDTMTRAKEEDRNVRVAAWIYAIKYESDNDFHVIVGTNPNGGAKTFFNAEISGLPAPSSSARAKLLAARQALAETLDNDLPGSNYHKFKTPIAVVIEGSLFFDVDHAAGVVGPAGMRPETAWEIHPVTKLTAQ